MLKKTLLLINLFFSLNGFSQNFEWAKSEPYPSYVQWVNKVAHNNFGNTFIGSAYIGGILLVSYDSNGNKVWEKNYYGYGDVTSLCTDNFGNVYAGIMISGLTIDGIQYHTHIGGGGYLFIKIDSSGNVVWVKHMDPSIYLSEKTDAQNNIIVSGNYQGTNYLDNGIILSSNNGASFYMAKFNLNGECIWALPEDGARFSAMQLSNGYMYANDYFYGSVTLGKGSKAITLYESNGMGYFAKYDSAGELLWVKQTHNSFIAPDEYGNFYAYENGKISKYDAAGNLLWNRTQIVVSDWYKGQIKCGNNGNLYISGGFANYIKIGDTTITGDANYHNFIAKIDSSGTLKWITTTVGTGSAGSKDITINGNEIYITGDMGGSNTFGAYTTTQPDGGVYVAKIIDNDVTPVKELQASINLFSVYPNPTGSVFNVYYKGDAADLIINITNQLGQNVLSKKYSSKKELQEIFDLSSHSKGVYFIELTANDKREVKKIVVQ